MAANASNVSVGKPKIGGAISVAPVGTTLPTDATTALDAAFKNLGYVSDSGLVNTKENSTGNINAWGGDSVLDYGNVTADRFKFTLIEVLNLDVLKMIYGSDNVTGDLDAGIAIAVGSQLPDEVALVVDMNLRNGALKRIVVPQCKVTGVGDITYADEEAVGYETTVSAIPVNGKYHHEYIIRPKTP